MKRKGEKRKTRQHFPLKADWVTYYNIHRREEGYY
jgi:hypothetical protein